MKNSNMKHRYEAEILEARKMSGRVVRSLMDGMEALGEGSLDSAAVWFHYAALSAEEAAEVCYNRAKRPLITKKKRMIKA